MEDTTTIAEASDLLLTAAVESPDPPRFSIVAYTGGVMKVGGWGSIAIDLSGLDLSASVPVLSDHNSTRAGVVGHGRAQVMDGRLVVAGVISAATQAAREIIASARNGFPWQASVGAEVLERRAVPAGEPIAVNGKSITAPAGGMTLVTKGRLREVSIVSLGGDADTTVAIAASMDKEQRNMDVQVQDSQTQEAEAAEAKRVEAVRKVCAGRHSDIEAKAIAENWDIRQTELAILRADRPKAPAVQVPAAVGGVETIEAALLLRMGRSALGEKALGPAAMEQGERLGAANMLDLCRTALLLDGQDVPRSKMELVRAALSTISLPTALGNTANKVLLDAYNETPASWRSFAAIRNVADFKTNTAIRPSFTVGLDRVAPGGELKHGTAGEWTMQFSIDTFGRMLSVDRRDLVNDDLSVFQDTARALGRAAMRRLSDLIFEVLLANANGFFSTGNGNYFDGADSNLNMESLAKAVTLMRTQRNADGDDLDIRPAVLLVGPESEPTARALLNSEFVQRDVDTPTGNALRQIVGLEVEPRLSNTKKYGSAASTKHWYLLAGPSYSPMVAAFLNGQQSPVVEFFGIQADVERLAASWRVYFDFGAALCDPRAAVRSKGQA
jgi:hypothetical protein